MTSVNHFSAANLKFPGDDARLDLTDLFLFGSPEDRDKTVLILDVNPFMTGSEFHPDGVYRINVDNQFPYRIYGGQQDNTSVSIASRELGGGGIGAPSLTTPSHNSPPQSFKINSTRRSAA